MCHSPTDSVSVSIQTASQQRSQQLQTQGSLVSAGTCNTEQQEQFSDLQQAFKTWRMHARIHKHYRCAALLRLKERLSCYLHLGWRPGMLACWLLGALQHLA